MRFHWQNLNERRGGSTGTILRHGRAWLHLGRYTLGWEWSIGRATCHAYVTVRPSGDSTIGGSIAVPGVALYAHLDAPWGHADRMDDLTRRPGSKYGTDRRTGVSVSDWMIRWDLWADDMEWRPREDRWRHGYLNVLDLLGGRAIHSERDIESRQVVVPMPEGCYPATARLYESTWKRRRWPFARRLMRITLDIPAGIPHRGKGENSWDCGDDATYGLTCNADSIEDGIGKAVASALEDRRRYGRTSDTPREPILAKRATA